MAQHHASPLTVQRALATLTASGHIETRPGIGTFVRADPVNAPVDYGWQTAALEPQDRREPTVPTALPPGADAVSMASGYPDRSLLPERLVRAAFTRATRSETLMDRAPALGLPELRSWFAAEVATASSREALAPTTRDVVVTPGSQSALQIVFRALVGAGKPVVMESPTYWGAIRAARLAGVRIVPVPSGPVGPDPEVLQRAIEQSGARACYVQPAFANPTGALWSREKSKQILHVARSAGVFLIEDDYAHDYGIDALPEPLVNRDTTGHVVYVRSLTKSVGPGVRVGAVIAHGPARDRIQADIQADSLYVSGILQAAALDVVTQPAWRTHLRRVGTQLGERRDTLLRSLTAHAPEAKIESVPRGGLGLWLRVPDEVELPRLIERCRAGGVIVGAGDEWFPAEPTGNHLRLVYSGAQPSRFDEATRILGTALRAN